MAETGGGAGDRSGRGPVVGHGRFELMAQVGSGAIGQVFAAHDRRGGLKVAIKMLRELTPDTLLNLKREFRGIQDLHHRNLVRFGELFEEDGRWFFSMEFIEGTTFLDHVRGAHNDNGPLAEARLRDAFAQLVSGIAALHGAGKVHRDVKPSNVLVDRGGRVVLLDFGIALDVARNHSSTRSGLVGTVAYMAPEQVLDESIGPAADFYALGVMLYEALTGRLPFQGAAHEILEAKLEARPRPPRELVPQIPEDLDALCRELLDPDPTARPGAEQVLARLGISGAASRPSLRVRDGVFVGRRAELDALRAAFAAAARGSTVVLVRGESGVGKSHLVQHFIEQLDGDERPAVLSGRCYERESVPFKAVDSVIDDLEELLSSLPADERRRLEPQHVQLLTQAFPVLTSVFSGEAPSELLVPEQLRQRTFAALRELLSKLSRGRRIVIAIDDIQWSDADSLAMMRALLEPSSAAPILWVLTARTDLESAQALRLPVDVRTLEVGKLDADEAATLARLLLATSAEERVPVALEAIVREANGHPLLIGELVRHGGLGDGKFAHLDDVLWSRVRRLPEAQRAVVVALAVAGAPVERDVISRAVAAPPGALFDLIVQLHGERLARTVSAGGDDTLCIYHDRVRESLVANLTSDERALWHRRLAQALEDSPRSAPESVASHWEGAGEAERAALYVQRAAEEASRLLAFERAALLYEKLLALRPVEGEARTAIEQERARAWSNAGHGEKAAAVRLALAEHLSGAERLEQQRLAAEELLTSGRYDDGISVLESVIRAVGLVWQPTRGRALLGLIGRKLQLRLRGFGFEAPAGEPSAEQRLAVDVASSGGLGLSMLEPVRGNYYQTMSALRALDLGEPLRVLRALAVESVAGGGTDKKRSAMMLEVVRRLAADIGTPEAQALEAVSDGGRAYFYGEWLRAGAPLDRAEELFRDHCVGKRFMLNSVRLWRYRVLGMRGDLQALRERVPPVLRDAEERGDLYSVVNYRATSLVLTALGDDDPERADAELCAAAAHLPAHTFLVQHYFCLLAQVGVALYRGDAAGALAVLREAWPRLEKSHLLRVATVRVQSFDLLGRAALAACIEDRSRIAELRGTLTLSVRRLRGEVDAWAHGLADGLDAGRALLEGDHERARSHLELAAHGHATHGMDLHAAAARLALARLAGPDAAAELERHAQQAMHAARVKSAARMARLLAPTSYRP
jgi:hypothetical protein